MTFDIRYKKRLTLPKTETGGQRELSHLAGSGNNVWALGASHLLCSVDGDISWSNEYPEDSALFSGLTLSQVEANSRGQWFLLAQRGRHEVFMFAVSEREEPREVHRARYKSSVWARIAIPDSQICCLVKGSRSPAYFSVVDSGTGGLLCGSAIDLRGIPADMEIDRRGGIWVLERWIKGCWIEEASAENRSFLHRSIDGGRSWSVISDLRASCMKMFFHESGCLFVLSDRGEIFASNDSGQSWRCVADSGGFTLHDMDALGNICIAIGTSDLIESSEDVIVLVSTDSGNTWGRSVYPFPDALFAVRMTTRSSGVIASLTGVATFEANL